MSFLVQGDPEVAQYCQKEFLRQESHLELIASENYVSSAVLEAQGSLLTNKYAEGYPGKRYYGGCEHVDEIERLAQQRLCQLFGAEAANVQPHSGSQANLSVFFTLLKPGDAFLGMSLEEGGHLTHGSSVNFSGKWFRCFSYGLGTQTQRIDYDQIRDLAKKEKPRMLLCGASAYPRRIDFSILGAIAKEFEIPLVADIAHIAGLVAVGLHPSPIPYAQYTMTTTHKTLRGPRGGAVLCRQADLKALNAALFPGTQGGPLMHVIAAKAVAFKEALDPAFKTYQEQTLKNASALAEALLARGYDLVTGGTDNHLLLIDFSKTPFLFEVSGQQAETWLGEAHLTVNKNRVPGDTRSPLVTSGLRVGTPAMTTRRLKEPHMEQVAGWMDSILRSQGEASVIEKVKAEVQVLCREFPVYLSPLKKDSQVSRGSAS